MLAAILPVFLLIMLGVAIRRAQWMPEDFFPSMEKFSYFIAFPALLFTGIAKLDFQGRMVGELALATLLPTLIVVGLTLLLLLPWRGLPDASRSSVIQGAMRPNSYFGIAVSALLFPPQINALVMLALALCLPVVNVISILALSWWSGRKVAPSAVAKTLATNPIILATLAGIGASVGGLALPAPLLNTLDILGKSALALGLLCVGSGLVFSLEGLRPAALALTSALKLMALPLVAAQVCAWFGVSEAVTLAACFYCALPTAPNAYIMARQLGGDARLMASLITLQTLLAAVTIPAVRLLAF
ncbi:AEC family transporter [Pseudoduganella sp. DS3]|uniref:AEC family transporter n=1 Tax=Pseudoduganella guangdongensis TaxID=2692179 RepID=A0A6N9HB58_9BURK|nr:AEC family transporter [Pseudoduganella guangdongensis]MYN00689.1 AEC family transporter [Pseudoduganella guangdongensis]